MRQARWPFLEVECEVRASDPLRRHPDVSEYVRARSDGSSTGGRGKGEDTSSPWASGATTEERLCVLCRRRLVVSGFDGLDGLAELLFQHALADDPGRDPEHSSLEVLALADDDD